MHIGYPDIRPLLLARSAQEGQNHEREVAAMPENGPDSVPESEPHSVICAWCDRPISEGKSGLTSHGICLTCLGKKFDHAIENVALLNRRVSDLLPFGFIRLDEKGVVTEYNTAESTLSGLPREGVLGRNFFRAVAPCTCVEQFEGKVQEMIAAGKPARDQIEFLFKFPRRVTMVNLAMIYDPARHEVVLLIRKAQQQGIRDGRTDRPAY
jgi:photoactive yellow protein